MVIRGGGTDDEGPSTETKAPETPKPQVTPIEDLQISMHNVMSLLKDVVQDEEGGGGIMDDEPNDACDHEDACTYFADVLGTNDDADADEFILQARSVGQTTW